MVAIFADYLPDLLISHGTVIFCKTRLVVVNPSVIGESSPITEKCSVTDIV